MADASAPQTNKLERHPIVSLYHVHKRYARCAAVHDVSVHVENGEFLFMVGPSGAGKSTILRLIYMEEFPTEGQVTVAGFVSSRMKRSRIPHLRRKVGLIFQDFKLLEDRNIFENVAFPLYVTGANRNFIRRTVLDLLGRVGLYQKRNNKPHELSGGEQQRVAIARALVNSPYVLLADEPTGNLDPVVAREILKLLFEINNAGTAVIMATHDHEMVRRYGQRILHIEQGEIVQDELAFDRWSSSNLSLPLEARAQDAPQAQQPPQPPPAAPTNRPLLHPEPNLFTQPLPTVTPLQPQAAPPQPPATPRSPQAAPPQPPATSRSPQAAPPQPPATSRSPQAAPPQPPATSRSPQAIPPQPAAPPVTPQAPPPALPQAPPHTPAPTQSQRPAPPAAPAAPPPPAVPQTPTFGPPDILPQWQQESSPSRGMPSPLSRQPQGPHRPHPPQPPAPAHRVEPPPTPQQTGRGSVANRPADVDPAEAVPRWRVDIRKRLGE